jgi:hypothetical protein
VVGRAEARDRGGEPGCGYDTDRGCTQAAAGWLYAWRQQILGGQLGPLVRTVPSFAEVEAAVTPSEVDQPDDTAMRSTSSPTPAVSLRVAGQIEILLASGVVLRVDAQVNERALRRVLAALEAR